MRRGGTGRFGFTHAKRFSRRGISARPISSTYLKPSVTSMPVRAPRPSRIALVATVEPWKRSLIAARPASSSPTTRSTPVKKPRAGSSGTDETFAVRTVPPSFSTTSVKVPPTSTPTRRLDRKSLFLYLFFIHL